MQPRKTLDPSNLDVPLSGGIRAIVRDHSLLDGSILSLKERIELFDGNGLYQGSYWFCRTADGRPVAIPPAYLEPYDDGPAVVHQRGFSRSVNVVTALVVGMVLLPALIGIFLVAIEGIAFAVRYFS